MASPGSVLAQLKMHKSSLEASQHQQSQERLQRSMAMLTRVGMQFQQMRQEKQLLAQRGQQTAALQKQAQAGRLATGKEVADYERQINDPLNLKKKRDKYTDMILEGRADELNDGQLLFAKRPDLTSWGRLMQEAQAAEIFRKKKLGELQIKEQGLINQYKAIKNEQESPFGQARAAVLGGARDFIGNLGKARKQASPKDSLTRMLFTTPPDSPKYGAILKMGRDAGVFPNEKGEAPNLSPDMKHALNMTGWKGTGKIEEFQFDKARRYLVGRETVEGGNDGPFATKGEAMSAASRFLLDRRFRSNATPELLENIELYMMMTFGQITEAEKKRDPARYARNKEAYERIKAARGR